MNKNAAITAESEEPSPCEACGHPSVTVLAGVPYCARCMSVLRSELTRPQAIDKVAADLQNHF